MTARTTPAVPSGRRVRSSAVEGVAEGVHFLLDDVGDGAEAPGEELGGLDDGRADLAVAIAARPGGDDFLEALPARRGLRQQVVHAFDAGEFLSCHRGCAGSCAQGLRGLSVWKCKASSTF